MIVKAPQLHINLDKLIQTKIPLFRGRGAESNRLILKSIAFNGPLLKYDVFKILKSNTSIRYSTISRRIDDLRKRGYLTETGKRATERGKKKEEMMYSLTWRGFIASLSIKEVRENVFQVLEKNPLLKFPEKEFVLSVLKEIFTKEEFEAIITPIFQGYLEAIPNIESIRDEHLILWISAIREIPPIPKEALSKINWIKLLDNPKILEYVKDKILPVIDNWEKQIHDSWLAIKELNAKLREYIEMKLLGNRR